jgi:hypothetical protein
MPTPAELPSYSIVVETENLSLADDECLWRSLASISRSMERVNYPPEKLLIVNSGDLPEETCNQLAVKFPSIELLRAPPGANYYESKMLGVYHSTSDIVVFADSDCQYNRDWLSGLLEPFRDPTVSVVAGETSFLGRGPYVLAMNIIHSFDGYSDGATPHPVNGYYANNFAARRELFVAHPIPTRLPLYRHGCSWHCVQLRRLGEVILAQPRSRAGHATPEGLSHFFWRFLLFGRDRSVRSRIGLVDNAPQAMPKRGGVFGVALGRMRRALRQQPSQVLWLPVSFVIVVVASSLIRIGQVLARNHPELAISHFGTIEGVRYPTVEEYLATPDALTSGDE